MIGGTGADLRMVGMELLKVCQMHKATFVRPWAGTRMPILSSPSEPAKRRDIETSAADQG